MVELSSCSDLQNNVDIEIVIEKSIHFDDIRMVKISLYLQLSDELICYFFFY